MTEFWKGIQALFEEFLFIPLNFLRDVQFDSWWLANIVNIILILIGMAAFTYWMLQLRDFQDEERENAAHSDHTHALRQKG